jgi:hypothetical protein
MTHLRRLWFLACGKEKGGELAPFRGSGGRAVALGTGLIEVGHATGTKDRQSI